MVFRVDLEAALGVGADGTDPGGLQAHGDAAAAAAFRDPDLAPGEKALHFDVFQQGAAALLMMLFDRRHHMEFRRRGGESLFFGASGFTLTNFDAGCLQTAYFRLAGGSARGTFPASSYTYFKYSAPRPFSVNRPAEGPYCGFLY